MKVKIMGEYENEIECIDISYEQTEKGLKKAHQKVLEEYSTITYEQIPKMYKEYISKRNEMKRIPEENHKLSILLVYRNVYIKPLIEVFEILIKTTTQTEIIIKSEWLEMCCKYKLNDLLYDCCKICIMLP